MNQQRKQLILEILKAKNYTALRKDVQSTFMEKTNLGESIFKNIVKEMLEATPPLLYQSKNRTSNILSTHPLEFELR